MKNILTIVVIIFLLLEAHGSAFAQEVSDPSAMLNSTILPISNKETDNRAQILQKYLEEHDSPLAPYAGNFVKSADKYNLDWKLVASIAGLESTFGKHTPANSYNGWGWGYNGGSVKHFTSWDEAIDEISRGLRENYLKADSYSDPYMIGPTYAASPTWAVRVTYFMNQIEVYRARNTKSTLALAL